MRYAGKPGFRQSIWVSLVLLFTAAWAGQGAAQSTDPPWGSAQVREAVRIHGCTVYVLVSDPEHVFWTVCDAADTSSQSKAAAATPGR